jgi:hypothetical protein
MTEISPALQSSAKLRCRNGRSATVAPREVSTLATLPASDHGWHPGIGPRLYLLTW